MPKVNLYTAQVGQIKVITQKTPCDPLPPEVVHEVLDEAHKSGKPAVLMIQKNPGECGVEPQAVVADIKALESIDSNGLFNFDFGSHWSYAKKWPEHSVRFLDAENQTRERGSGTFEEREIDLDTYAKDFPCALLDTNISLGETGTHLVFSIGISSHVVDDQACFASMLKQKS